MPSDNPLLIRAAAIAQVVVDDLDTLTVSPEDHHHLAKVLRIRNGEVIVATDGQGSWRTCLWRDGLRAEGVAQFEPRSHATEIAFALTKGDKPEWIVQKLTEIGIRCITPFRSERSIVKWDDAKAEKHVARFRRIAYEAAMQSRQVWLPEVRAVASFDDVLAREFAIAAPGDEDATPNVHKIAVGPEGGWSDAELRRANVRVSLGSTILRAETAAVVAAARLQVHS
jgi:16S rRNA (uracil1498-N3)-methyltransferase